MKFALEVLYKAQKSHCSELPNKTFGFARNTLKDKADNLLRKRY